MSYLLGLDYGSGTVGVAAAEGEQGLARPLETIYREKENHLRKTCARIEELVVKNGVETLVVGLPLNMNGQEGERAAAAREFAQMVRRRTGLKVVLVDERLTSVEAERLIKENHSARDAEKMVREEIDSVAAALILQDYLDNGRGEVI